MGQDVVSMALGVLNNGEDIAAYNHTHIVLIPKKQNCASPSDFRPISLCNVLYKVVTKVLANRVKKVLPSLISDAQSGFVPGRLITDNVLVAHECFHYLRKKKKGKKSEMALKLDMSKAYDRVEWSFLRAMMEKMRFPVNFVDIVMKCVSSASFTILVNGQPTRSFTSSRGLRQGDPLSPFLFVICAEGLSALIQDAERRKAIHGVRIGRRVENISHLLFADDSLLFTRATEEEVECVLDLLSIYEAASGQKLNMEKSVVSFSRNIEPDKKILLLEKLNFKAVDDHDSYLGLPTYVGCSKKAVFQSIQDRVWKKLKGWKEKFLSQAGREILIKSVAQAIPLYMMQCFKLPMSVISEIEKMCRRFFWGQKAEERKIPWVAWPKMCMSKKAGGMGLRDLEAFNQAVLAKQGWRILINENSLMTRVLKGKYFPSCSFIDAKQGSNMSFTWRSILQARPVLMKGLYRVIGDGRSTRIWGDPWLQSGGNGGMGRRQDTDFTNVYLVADLIENGRWNVDYAKLFLSDWEVDTLQKINIPMFSHEDWWGWKFTKDGSFSVKSAYYQAVNIKKDHLPSSSNVALGNEWQDVWKAEIPPKVRHFAWRALWNALSTNVNLAKRGVRNDVICARCGEEAEDVFHLLAKCQESWKLWYLSPLRLDTWSIQVNDFRDWVMQLRVAHKDHEWWEMFWMLCWTIWLQRNDWVFNLRRKELVWRMAKASSVLNEYKITMAKQRLAPSVREDRNDKWKAPPSGVFKLNSDVAKGGDDRWGLGAVVRDEVGDVLLAMCDCWQGVCSVESGEAAALRAGLKTAIEAGFSRMIIEVDCLGLFYALSKRKGDLSAHGLILKDIWHLCSLCQYVSFSFIRRNGNKVAHALAQRSLVFNVFTVWIEEAPQAVMNFVREDLVA